MKLPIAIFVRSFPKLSETFVLNQVTGLIDKGRDVHVIALESANEDTVHEEHERYGLAERTSYLFASEVDAGQQRVITYWMRRATTVLAALTATCLKVAIEKVAVKQKRCQFSARTLFLAHKIKYMKATLPQFDMIIAHFGPIGSLAALLRELGVLSGPVVTFFHGYDLSKRRMIELHSEDYRALFVRGELMLPVSQFWRRRLLEWGCADQKIQVQRMGVDPDVFKFRHPERPLGRPVKVISVCRVTEKKGLDFAVSAVAKLSHTVPVDYTIIGSGALLQTLERSIRRLNANIFIRCLGDQSQLHVREQLAGSDVFLLPSVTAENGDMEGVPVALMESMAIGLITVSTTHSGIAELISDGEDGYLAPERDADALCAILLAITEKTSAELAQIRQAARNKIEAGFNVHKLNGQLLSLANNMRQ